MSGEYTRMVNEIRSLLHQINDKLDDKTNRTKEDNLRLIMRRMGNDNFTDAEIERELMPTLSKADFDAIMPTLERKLEHHRRTATNDYASEDNVFSNFIEEGSKLDVDPKKVLGIYMDKHLTSITRWMRGKESQRESIQGRIEDAINYLKLAWAWAEVEGKVNTTSTRVRYQDLCNACQDGLHSSCVIFIAQDESCKCPCRKSTRG